MNLPVRIVFCFIFYFILLTLTNCISLFPHKGTGYIPVLDFDGKVISEFPRGSKWIGFDETKYFPLSELEKFPNLESLEIRSPRFRDVSHLAKLNKLTFLNLDGTSIENVGFLKELTLLRTLILNNTRLIHIDPPAPNNKISKLHLYKTKIRSIDFLKFFPELRHLDVRKTEISDLKPVSNCKKLMDIQIGDTNIKDLDSISLLKDLLYLDIDGLDLKPEEIENLKKSNPYLKIVKRKYF